MAMCIYNFFKKTFFSIILLSASIGYAVDIEVSWKLNPIHENIKSYVIYMARNNDRFVPTRFVSGNVNKFLFTELSPGNYYKFYVLAINDSGVSPRSDIVTVLVSNKK